ncbi:hypothetical protein EJD97_017270 [Solanum chilense]|uniref:CASP-like protein n=1 Tax=Solanum chilense TaxID=4083 RepID=A0A6N2B628_SOLCI|nr:hypothetical protein EJD97_017270 [Solanum chilense]
MGKSKFTIISIVVLRILTLLTCKAAIAIIVFNKFTIQNGQETNFSSIRGYWYVLAIAAGEILYSLIQLPFSLYQAIKGKRLISGQFLPMFDFYGDKVMAFLLASGVGVGFGVSIELKNFVDESIDINEEDEVRVEFREKGDKFFDNGIIASGILLAGFTTMAIITILNSAKRTAKSF